MSPHFPNRHYRTKSHTQQTKWRFASAGNKFPLSYTFTFPLRKKLSSSGNGGLWSLSLNSCRCCHKMGAKTVVIGKMHLQSAPRLHCHPPSIVDHHQMGVYGRTSRQWLATQPNRHTSQHLFALKFYDKQKTPRPAK